MRTGSAAEQGVGTRWAEAQAGCMELPAGITDMRNRCLAAKGRRPDLMHTGSVCPYQKVLSGGLQRYKSGRVAADGPRCQCACWGQLAVSCPVNS